MISERVRRNLELQVSEIEEKERKLAHRKATILARLKSAQIRKPKAEIHGKVAPESHGKEGTSGSDDVAIRRVMDMYIGGSYRLTPLDMDQLVADLKEVGGNHNSLAYVLTRLGEMGEFDYTTKKFPEGENPFEEFRANRVLR